MASPTFLYEVAGPVHVAVHGDVNPRDEEWRAYLDDVAAKLDGVEGVIVFSTGGGPTADQRRVATEHWREQGRTPRIALLTTSTVVRTMLGTLKFFLGGSGMRAFRPDAYEEACEHLGVSASQARVVQAKVEELRAKLDAYG